MCDTKAYAIDHVICGGGNCTAQGPCIYDEVCPTLKAAGTHAVAAPIIAPIPCALRNRGGGKELEYRMNDDKANALTSVETDSLVCAARHVPESGGVLR